MTSTLFLIFILILPIFGKSLDFTESVFFYGFSLIFFFYFLHKKKKLFFEKEFILILIILTILLLFSTITSKIIGLSYYQFFVYLDIILLFTFAVAIIKPEKIKIGLVIASSIYCLVFLLNKIGILSLEIKPLSDNFILQIWGHSYLADFIVFSIPILVCYLAEEKEKKKIYPLFLILFIILISLFLTNSRSALLSLMIGLIFLKTTTPSQKIIKKIIFTGIILSLLVLSVLVIKNKIRNKTFLGNRIKYFESALVGFSKYPIFGNGIGTYSFIEKKYQTEPFTNTFVSHNSFATFLSENGLIFTLIFFISIVLSLKKTYKTDNLFFVCSLIAICHSFLDPTWESSGIFVLSLYFIFFYSLQYNKTEKSKSSKLFVFTPLIILLFFTSKTISDLLFLQGKFRQSIFFDPFNLNSRIAIIKNENPNSQIWQKTLKFSLKYFKNNDILYKTLVEKIPFPDNEIYYYKLFEINPKENNKNYLNLIDLYKKNYQKEKLEKLLYLIIQNSVNKQFTRPEQIIIEKILYRSGIENFNFNPEKTIDFLNQCLKYEPALSYFHIELANAYWHTGQRQKAFEQINNCLKINVAQQHCQWYLDNFQNQFLYPGQKEFTDYIDNQLKP